jgi:hypothetical protein
MLRVCSRGPDPTDERPNELAETHVMLRTLLITTAMAAALNLAALGVSVRAVAPDSGADSEGEFLALFDGKTLQGWNDGNGRPPSKGWEVVDGAIHRRERAGYLVSDQLFDNFDLRFEWKIPRGTNSGVKYRTTRVEKKGLYGCEYQLLDDDNHVNGLKATTRCAALYDLYAPDESVKVLKPVGEYNTSRVVAQGTRIEHWLNGRKVLEVDTAGDDWKQRIARSKFRAIKDFAAEKPGPIMLQDHNSEVWFRKVVIRRLPSRPVAE